MNALPQRKKTTEEPSRLRDGLGIRQPQASMAPHAHSTQGQMAYTQPAQPPRPPKPVRSLRRAERDPAATKRHHQAAPPYSPIPARRHSREEIQDLIRRDALARLSFQAPPLPFQPAPLWLTAPGYLLAVSAYACLYWTEIPLPATAVLAIMALLIAAYILLRRPLSRHHAAFIGITTLFAIVFAALHYFPQLRHAS